MAASVRSWQRLWRFSSDFVGAAGVQGLIQALGFLSSILIIRWTSPAEYALYTIALSLQGAMATTADAGIAANVMAQGGRVWTDKGALGRVIAAGIYMRRRLATILTLSILPFGFYLIQKSSADFWSATAIILAVLLSFVAHLPGAILEVPLKLHQDFGRIFKIRLASTLLRVAVLASFAFFYPMAWIFIAAAGAIQAAFNPLLSRFASRYMVAHGLPTVESLSELRTVVSRSLPGAIYYSVQSQVSLWLLTVFGISQAVADLGALGRLAAISVLVTVAFDTVVVPRFAKLQSVAVLPTLTRTILVASLLLGFAAWMCILATEAVLSLLGPHYSHLQVEFSLLCVSTTTWLLASFVWTLNNARAYIPPWFVYPISGIVYFSCFSLLFGVSTPMAALATQLAMGVAALATNTAVSIYYYKLDKRGAR